MVSAAERLEALVGLAYRRGGDHAMSDPLLTADDVAALLGVSKDWIYGETRAGRIPHVKLGRHRRYRRESIDAWIADLEAGGSVSATNRGGAARTARPTAPRK